MKSLFNDIELIIKNRFGIIVISMFIIFLSTRLFHLERDVPPWDITMYSSFDEQLYVIPAFNMYNHGSMKYQVVDWLPDDIPMLTNSMLGNLMTFFTFKIFGNNYYGLRMSAVVASFVVVVLLFKLLWLQGASICKKKNFDKYSKIVYLVIGFFVIINFPFVMASRVYETTIIRMMAMMILMYLATKYINDNRQGGSREVFLFGLFVGTGVWFVYITNIFFLPAFGLFVLVQGVKKGWVNGGKYLTLYCLGVFGSIIIHSAVYYAIYDQFYWKEIFRYINDPLWGGRRVNVIAGDTGITLIKSMWSNTRKFLNTNIFSMNINLSSFFILAVPFLMYRIMRFRKGIDIVIGSILFFIFLQSLFINDFYERKLVILFPLVILIIYGAVIEIISIINRNDMKMNIRVNQKFLKYFGSSLIIAGIILNEFLLIPIFSNDGIIEISTRIKILIFQSFLIGSGIFLLFSKSVKSIHFNIDVRYLMLYYLGLIFGVKILSDVLILFDENYYYINSRFEQFGVLMVIIALPLITYKLLSKYQLYKKREFLTFLKISVFYLLVTVFLPEVINNYQYIYYKPEFKHRDAMKSIASLVNGKKGTGFGLGMRLYNNGWSYENGYVNHYKKDKQVMRDIIERMIKENQLDYNIQRLSSPDWFYQWMERWNFKLIKEFELPVYGKMGLWMKTLH